MDGDRWTAFALRAKTITHQLLWFFFYFIAAIALRQRKFNLSVLTGHISFQVLTLKWLANKYRTRAEQVLRHLLRFFSFFFYLFFNTFVHMFSTSVENFNDKNWIILGVHVTRDGVAPDESEYRAVHYHSTICIINIY